MGSVTFSAAKAGRAREAFARLVDCRLAGDCAGAEAAQRELARDGVYCRFVDQKRAGTLGAGPASVSIEHSIPRAQMPDGGPLELVSASAFAKGQGTGTKAWEIEQMAVEGWLPHFRFNSICLFDTPVAGAVLLKRIVERGRYGLHAGPAVCAEVNDA